jgi:cation diffusion facilitator CzcD-associated flavoprotein CzcO
MSEARTPAEQTIYDAIVIGAGMCGITFLKYARDQDLRCIALEKQDDVGGLWNWIPAWQDIQNRVEDFAINGVPLEGAAQPDIHRYAQDWIRRYELAPFIKLRCEVSSVSWVDQEWHVQTNQGEFRSNYLIVASGVQNEPWTPDVERFESKVLEMHSSELQRPEDLADQRVTIVGGAASGWDLLSLAIQHGAKELHWVYRSRPHWFMPTTKSKQDAWPNLRELAIVQTLGRSARRATAFLRWLLRKKYDAFGLDEIEPNEPFDIQKHQLIPGRSAMLENLDAIARHQSEVRRIRGTQITLKNGEHFETDMLLWGTGYHMNLAYLGLPEYSQIEVFGELFPALGSLVRSLDYPNLFFVGMSLAESTSSTPFLAAIEAKSIVAHILGRCEIPEKNVPHHVAYWNLFGHFASFDRANYPRVWWKIKYFVLAWWYVIFRNKSLRV